MNKVNLNENEIIALYQSGLSTIKIGKMFGCSNTTISKRLKELKIKMRSNKEYRRKYNFNENFFESIDTQEKAYWLGWMFSDGCVRIHKNKNHKQYCIKLACCDEEVILNFIKDINGNMSCKQYIRPDRTNQLYQVDITSEKMFNDLCTLGCVPNKSLILKFPKIQEQFVPHFIRGYFDGDGCVYSSKKKRIKTKKTNPRIVYYDYISSDFTGTKEMLEEINKRLNWPTFYREMRRTGNTWYIKTSSTPRVEKFYHYLYDDATRYLTRKKDIFKNYFNKDVQRL